MALEKVKELYSIEILVPSKAINAAWHTYIMEDGEVISGPSVFRAAYPHEDMALIQPEIDAVVGAQYSGMVNDLAVANARITTLTDENLALMTQVSDLQAQLDALNQQFAKPADPELALE